MKKILLIVFSFLLVGIAALNYTALPYSLGLKTVTAVYKYQNELGQEVVEIPAKGRHMSFEDATITLVRKFKMKPYAIWMWHDYLFHPRWKLDYYQ